MIAPSNTPAAPKIGVPLARVTRTPMTTALAAQSSNTLPARISRFACDNMVCKLEMLADRRRSVSNAGISLSIWSRKRASSSLGLRSAGFWTDAKRSRSRRARAFRWSSREPTEKAPAATTMKIRMAMRAGMTASSDLHPRFKQGWPKAASGHRQAVGKFRTNSGGSEYTLHLAAFIQSQTIKRENILHDDLLVFHSTHFGN